MLRRTRTRAEELQDRITAERAINAQRLKQHRWLFEELEKRRQARGLHSAMAQRLTVARLLLAKAARCLR